jgi:LL-diaminopimelate aminotransferase
LATIKIEKAQRLKQLPPYLFAKLDQLKQEARDQGMDIISLGVGDPDIATPEPIIKSLKTAADNPANHQYPSYEGMLKFREAAAEWCQKRFSVSVDPQREVITLIGSKEGIGHIPLAFVNPNDYVLVPSPGYPVYNAATILAEGIPYVMPLKKENRFLPDLSVIPEDVAKKTKIMYLNYPNNPTSAVADHDFFDSVVKFAVKYNIIVCHDMAYSEITYDGYRPPSFLECDGAKEVGVEFHSLSKTFNMTGWRIGFAAGNAEVINGLGGVKTNIDSGAFQAIQEAGITAMKNMETTQPDTIQTYRERCEIVLGSLRQMGIDVQPPKATFYIWFAVPGGNSAEFCSRLLQETGVVLTPGVGFGESGEGYARIALTVEKERLKEAMTRMEKLNI